MLPWCTPWLWWLVGFLPCMLSCHFSAFRSVSGHVLASCRLFSFSFCLYAPLNLNFFKKFSSQSKSRSQHQHQHQAPFPRSRRLPLFLTRCFAFPFSLFFRLSHGKFAFLRSLFSLLVASSRDPSNLIRMCVVARRSLHEVNLLLWRPPPVIKTSKIAAGFFLP